MSCQRTVSEFIGIYIITHMQRYPAEVPCIICMEWEILNSKSTHIHRIES